MKEKYKNSIVFRFVVKKIIRYTLRACLSATYLWSANKYGLLNHGIAANAMIWLFSLLLARYVTRIIERVIYEEMNNKEEKRST